MELISLVEEGDHGVFQVSFRKLQVLTLDCGVVGTARLGQVLQADKVLIVEVGGVEWKELAMLVKLLEPCGLLWIDHSIFAEFNEQCLVYFHKS